MLKNLIIINEKFPFGNGESFMENEVPLIDNFDKIYIYPCSVTNFEICRKINNSKIEVINLNNTNSIIIKAFKLFRYIKCLFEPLVIKDIVFLAKYRKLNYKTIKSLLSFISVANNCISKIKKHLINEGVSENDELVFYSYWMHFHSYIAIKLKSFYPNSITVTRCHGFDLYEYRNKYNYLPLRKFILENIDIIFSISYNGKEYLENRYSNIKKNIVVSRLGTIDNDIRRVDLTRKPLKIISSSWVTSVKRVTRIIDVLSKIQNIDIVWTHYGDGILFSQLKEYAKNKLGGNISYNLPGAISNNELMQVYRNKDFHLFINVSESEGIPVSIMEAMSFGIPVVATDVGGVNEIVVDNFNGYLLEKDFNDYDLVNIISNVYNMENNQYLKLRENARNFWAENYNAKKNYVEFYRSINKFKEK